MRTTGFIRTLLVASTLSSASWATSPATDYFISKATIGNKFEIDSSKLALDRSKDAEVRSFATAMVNDHSHALKDMKAVLPSDADPMLGDTYDAAHQQKLQQLEAISDEQFDAAYIGAQKDAHKDTIALFQDYAKKGDEKELKDFASATLPRLKAHQTHVESFTRTKEGYVAGQPVSSTAPAPAMPGEQPHAVQRTH